MGVVHIRNVKLSYESQKNLVSSLLKASFVLGNCDKSISTPVYVGKLAVRCYNS